MDHLPGYVADLCALVPEDEADHTGLELEFKVRRTKGEVGVAKNMVGGAGCRLTLDVAWEGLGVVGEGGVGSYDAHSCCGRVSFLGGEWVWFYACSSCVV